MLNRLARRANFPNERKREKRVVLKEGTKPTFQRLISLLGVVGKLYEFSIPYRLNNSCLCSGDLSLLILGLMGYYER